MVIWLTPSQENDILGLSLGYLDRTWDVLKNVPKMLVQYPHNVQPGLYTIFEIESNIFGMNINKNMQNALKHKDLRKFAS